MATKELALRSASPINLFFILVHFVFLVLILYYLQQLKVTQCECALTPEYERVRKIVIFLVAYNALAIILASVFAFTAIRRPNNRIYRVAMILLGVSVMIVDLVFFILSLKYISYLYRVSCKCSDNSYRLMYFIYSIWRIVLYSLTFFLLIIFLFFLSRIFSKSS